MTPIREVTGTGWAVVALCAALSACSPTGGSRGVPPHSSGTDTPDGTEGLNFMDTGFQVSDDGALDTPTIDDSTTPPTDAGPTPTDEGGVDVADPGPPPTDDGIPPPDTEPDPPPQPITGGVLVVQVESNDLEVGSVSARFRYGPAPEPAAVATDGPCKVVYSDGKDPPPDPAPGLDSGTIEVSGLNQPMTMTPANQGGSFVYASGLSEDNKSILGPGATVSVTAKGGKHLPSWATAVTVPQQVAVYSPSSGAVDKDKNLTVQWNPGNGTAVRIDLLVVDGAAQKQLKGNTITCTIAGDTGSHPIGAQLMKKLPGGGKEGFPDFNFDYLVYGVTRLSNASVALPAGFGAVDVAVSRSAGGFVKLED